MIDIELLRTDPEKVKKAVAAKQFDFGLVDRALELDGARRKLLGEVEKLRAERNRIADLIGNKKVFPIDNIPAAGSGVEETKDLLIRKGSDLKERLKESESQLEKAEKDFQEVFGQIPNLPLPSVPVGTSEKENVEIRKWGEPRKFDFEPKDHLELGKTLGILDFETGAKVSGSQFYFLYGDGALLELALVSYALELLSKEGF